MSLYSVRQSVHKIFTIKSTNFDVYLYTSQLNSDLKASFKYQTFLYEEQIPPGTIGEFVKQASNILTVPDGYEVFGTTVVHGGSSFLANILDFVWHDEANNNFIQATNFYRANADGGYVRFIVKVIYNKL